MEDEAARAQLAKDFPSWRIWRNGDLVYAWLLGSKPPLVLHAATVAELREQIENYEGEQHGGGSGG